VIDEVPPPRPGKRQVLVDVHAIGVTYPDVLIIQDLYQFKPPRPFSPGGEFAGRIAALGEGVADFAVGDRVIASLGWGAMAEQVVIDAWRCARMPEAMPYEEGAALFLTYGTAHHALVQRASLRPGETLLVLGAAGGVGIAAIEVGKALGATVVAAASSEEKCAFARAAGADRTLVYPRGPLDRDQQKALAESFKAACGGGANVVFDAVGGDFAEPALRAIAVDGRFLVVGFPAGIPRIPLNLPLLKNCQIVGVFWGDWVKRCPDEWRRSQRELFAMWRDGRIRPRISARLPLERGGEAIALLADRHALGKVVVTVTR
jgi:NADPH2:quinone reductase